MADSGDLSRWLAEARVDQAARSRARERWLRQQAGEEATLSGVLLDLAERGSAVVVEVVGGRRHRGTVTVVAEDFCALRSDHGEALLAYTGIAAVLPLDAVAPTGDRPQATDLTLREALAVLVGERPRLLVVTNDGSSRAGELASVGRDVVLLRTDGDPRHAYVALSAIAEVAITA